MVKKILLITAVIMAMTFAISNVLLTAEYMSLPQNSYYDGFLYFIVGIGTMAILAFFDVKYAVFLRDFKVWRVILIVALGLFTIFVFVLLCYFSPSAIYPLFNTIAAVELAYTVGIFVKDINKDEEWKLITILSIIGLSLETLIVVIYNAIEIVDWKQDAMSYCLILVIPIATITLAIFSFVYQRKEKVKNKLSDTKQ